MLSDVMLLCKYKPGDKLFYQDGVHGLSGIIRVVMGGFLQAHKEQNHVGLSGSGETWPGRSETWPLVISLLLSTGSLTVVWAEMVGIS